MLRVIRCVMNRVREFHSVGDIYYEILQRAYFSKEKEADLDIADDLHLERSNYYRKKKEAVLFFGVLLWEEAKNRKFA